MRRAPALALSVVLVVGGILLLAASGVLVISNTSWGRERARRIALSWLRGQVHGQVSLGGISGNLLTGVTAHDLVLRDSGGVLFIAAPEVRASYHIGDLISRHIELYDVTLVRPTILLDKPPGGAWNWKRLFPGDTSRAPKPAGLAWGDWVKFEDVVLLDGRLTIRNEWKPDTTYRGARRDSVVAHALGGGERLHIVRVKGGYQKISEMRDIYATLPRFWWSNPAMPHQKLAEVSSARMTAAIFRPPVATVTGLKGTFVIGNDSAWWDKVRVHLPGSDFTMRGRYTFQNDGLYLDTRGAHISLADMRWIYPRLPSEGTASADFRLLWSDSGDYYLAKSFSLRSGAATASGDVDIRVTDTIAVRDARVRFAGVDTHLLEQVLPGFSSPRHGVLGGRAMVQGGMHAVHVDADVAFDDPHSGHSRVIARGDLGRDGTAFRARGLALTLEPLQMDLARAVAPTLPLGGTLSGTMTLNGSGRTWHVTRADLTHVEGGARSRAVGDGEVRLAAGRGDPWIRVHARLLPLSLAVAGRFAPSLGLQGSVSGPIELEGSPQSLALRTDLRVAGGGAVRATGRVGLGVVPTYDLRVALTNFNAAAVTSRAPKTGLTGLVLARGRGSNPATMQATIAADLSPLRLDTLSLDSARVRVVAANGLLRVDDLLIRGRGAVVTASGSFGLAAGHSGTLRYALNIDSLQHLSGFVPRDSTKVLPRPGILAKAVKQARSDSAQFAERTTVERAAIGGPEPKLVVDTPKVAVRVDSISGSLWAAGVITGSLEQFDLRGRTGARDLVYNGYSVRALKSEYAVTNARTPTQQFVLAAHADSAYIGGFLLDSADTRLVHHSGTGEVMLAVRQDNDREYGLSAGYALHADHNELHLRDVRLRFDTTLWRGTRPGAVHWGARGIELHTIDLVNDHGGRIYADGLIGNTGGANLTLAIDNFELGDLSALLESDIEARGLLSLHAKVEGSMRDPRLKGAIGIVNFVYNGATLPELHGTFNYANRQLTTHAEIARAGGQPMIVADGTMPIDLTMQGGGPRLPDLPLSFEVTADSLPMEAIPSFIPVLSNVHGRAAGHIVARGTFRHPVLTGALVVDRGTAHIGPLGVTLHEIAGTIHMRGDTIVVDSLVGYNGGPVRLTGGLGIGSVNAPSFDLHLAATNATLLDSELGRARVDADVDLRGPFSSAVATGSVRVRNGVIYLPDARRPNVISAGDPALFSVIDTSVAADREIMPAESPLLKNIRVQLALRVDRDTWVRSRDVNVEIYSDGDLNITVDRSKRALTLDGIVSAERGEYTFLSKRFQVKRGSATFIGDPELNPTLQVRAEYEVRLPAREALVIHLDVGGTLRAPHLSLESDAQPPISQSDLLSYLAFGRASGSLLQLEGSGISSGSGGGGNLVGTTAALASQQLAAVALGVAVNQLESDAIRALGADVFNITPADVPSELWRPNLGSFLRGTEIEYGKYYSRRAFFGLTARPDPQAPPGARLVLRGKRGMWLETSVTPRYILPQPRLSPQTPASMAVFGMFLVREWRF